MNKENCTFSVSDREQVWSTYSRKAEYIFAPSYTITLKYGHRNSFSAISQLLVLQLFFKWHSWILQLLKVQHVTEVNYVPTNYFRIIELQCPPLSLTHKKRKERKYFPNTPQRLLNSWQDMQIIFDKKRGGACKLEGIYPALLQGLN